MDYLLGIDVGSSSVKTALFDTEGKMIALSINEYELIMPSPNIVEIEPDTFWQKLKMGVRGILTTSKARPEQIKAMAISSQGETFITLDKRGQPLRRAIFWYDNRATKEVDILADKFDRKTAYHITGMPEIIPLWSASKLLWLRENEPDVFSRAHKFLLVEDYLIYRLTGQYVGEFSCYPSTMILDIQNKCWWSDMLDVIGLDPGKLVELRESGQPVGPLTTEAAKDLGLAPETLVATGGYDHAAGAIGSGNTQPGVVTETTGSALVVNTTVAKPTFDPKLRVPCQYHSIPDRYFLSSFSETGGMAFKWLRDNFCLEEQQQAEKDGIKTAFAFMDDGADEIPAGSEGLILLPHLSGALCPEGNPNARGVLFGLALKHGKKHLTRAFLEGIAFMLRRHIEAVEEVGVNVEEVIGIGGGARSRIWGQIKADVLNKPVVHLETEEQSLLGAAILAGYAAGIYGDLETASHQMVKTRATAEPNPKNVAIYQELYERYGKIYERLADVFPKLRDQET